MEDSARRIKLQWSICHCHVITRPSSGKTREGAGDTGLQGFMMGVPQPLAPDHGIVSMWSVNVLPKMSFEDGGRILGDVVDSIFNNDGCVYQHNSSRQDRP